MTTARQLTAPAIPLVPGRRYDITQMVCVGWVGGDHTGYYYGDYFDRDGAYRGPDEHGIEPYMVQRVHADPRIATYRWMIRGAGDAPGVRSVEEPETRIEAASLADAEEQYAEMVADGEIDPDGEAQAVEPA